MTGGEDRALVASSGGSVDVLAAGDEVAAPAVIAVIGVVAVVSIGVKGDVKEGLDRREEFTGEEACCWETGFLRTGEALPVGIEG
jgi:hypothetical protein